MLSTFNIILQGITQAKSKETLQVEMGNMFLSPITKRYFNYGIEGSHMWLKQRSLNTPSNPEVRVNPDTRILIVKF
jgi:hypothetical protein